MLNEGRLYCPLTGRTTVFTLPSSAIQSSSPVQASDAFTKLYRTSASIGLSVKSDYDGALLKEKATVSPVHQNAVSVQQQV